MPSKSILLVLGKQIKTVLRTDNLIAVYIYQQKGKLPIQRIDDETVHQ